MVVLGPEPPVRADPWDGVVPDELKWETFTEGRRLAAKTYAAEHSSANEALMDLWEIKSLVSFVALTYAALSPYPCAGEILGKQKITNKSPAFLISVFSSDMTSGSSG